MRSLFLESSPFGILASLSKPGSNLIDGNGNPYTLAGGSPRKSKAPGRLSEGFALFREGADSPLQSSIGYVDHQGLRASKTWARGDSIGPHRLLRKECEICT